MLNPGTRVGAYEIVGSLGAGGMGEVYRARDAKLGRDVALKILPDAVRTDPERVARFEREARVLAGLNHTHIAGIYGFIESTGADALVMELVDGPTLADRISSGPLPVDDALAIAAQIADALEAAHEKAIVHRDLKPANIKVRDDGVVKVLDFGLAKALDPAEGMPSASGSVSMSPTLTAPTRLGMILGTAAYMSPEQARGKAVDKRTDIWAFGCVLYEMLAGRRAFHADEISDTLAFVLTKDLDWGLLPATTPPAISRLLRRCLEKDRKRRLADIADARLDIEDALRADDRAAHASSAAGRSIEAPWTRGLIPWIVAAAATAVAATAVLSWAPWKPALTQPSRRLSAVFGANVSLATTLGNPAIALSRDGSTLAFVGQAAGSAPQLYVRRLDQLNPTRLEGTDGASAPFFSPDGQRIAYFAEGRLKKIATAGGASITLCEAPSPRGGSWADDDTIVFAPASLGPLSRVSASGGDPRPMTRLVEGEVTHRWPQLLDDGKTVVFTASKFNGQYEDAVIVAERPPDGPRTVLATGGYFGRYVRSGHVLYVHAGTLFAVPVDPKSLQPRGSAVPVVESVSAISGVGSAEFAVGSDGTLVYTAGRSEDINAPLLWLDAGGKSTPLRTARANWGNPRFSPDGRRLAMNITGGQRQLWIDDWARDTMSQLTFDPANGSDPVWSPDGRDIVFASHRGADPVVNLYVQRADGSGQAARLTNSPLNQAPMSWHPSGRFLAFGEAAAPRARLMVLALSGDSVSGWKAGPATPLLDDSRLQQDAAFSPDGRWIAYSLYEVARPEIFVQAFPATGGKWKVSGDTGGRYPAWSASGHEIMFMSANGTQLLAASYTAEGASFRVEKPRLWGEARIARLNGQRGFDLHPDGTRVVVPGVFQNDAPKTDTAVFVFNFLDELRRNVAPATR